MSKSAHKFIKCRKITLCSLLILLIQCLFLLNPTIAYTQNKESDWFIYLGNKTPLKAPRKGISAAEALAPLPLPATPLRRTERKKPPQPDYLFGKVIWGKAASFTDTTGRKMSIADWNLCPTELQQLMQITRKVNMAYLWKNVNLIDFDFDAQKLPGLYISGVRMVHLDKNTLNNLHKYILNGGTVVCDSIAGSPYFYKSVKDMFAGIFPDTRFRKIPADHPVYHIMTDIDKINCPKQPDIKEPVLEAIYVGCRAAVIISKIGLGCGLNGDISRIKKLAQSKFYDISNARKIGLNIAAYIIGYADVGQREGRPELFGAADKKIPSDELIFAQIKHNGQWNVHPGAASALLAKLRRHTSMRVNLNRVAVNLDTDDLCSFGFLYLTGLDDFSFSRKEIACLRNYMDMGGVLIINNGLGLSTFDHAVQIQIKKLFPDKTLKLLSPNHGIYSSIFPLQYIKYTPALVKQRPELKNQPYILAIEQAGELKLIYSPYDFEAGWLGGYYPLMLGYRPESAEQLGMNLMLYLLTH